MPSSDTTYCQFGDVTGQPRAFRLPSASQARKRYAQAMAYMDQLANSQAMRHRLGSRTPIGPINCAHSCSSDAVLDVRPLNNRCSKTAGLQATSDVDANVTEGTNTHCVDSSSHTDSVDRHEPLSLIHISEPTRPY